MMPRYKVTYSFSATATAYFDAPDDTTARHDALAAAEKDITTVRQERGSAWALFIDVIPEVDEDSIMGVYNMNDDDITVEE